MENQTQQTNATPSVTENQTQQTNATPSDNPMAGVFNKVLNVLMEEMNKLVDARVEQIMATSATAALFNDELDARITAIAQEKAQEKFDELPSTEDAIHDEVVSALNDLDLCDEVERVFRNRVNWEGMVSSYIDELLDDKVEAEIDNVLEDKVDAMLEDKMREVLINIIKGE